MRFAIAKCHIYMHIYVCMYLYIYIYIVPCSLSNQFFSISLYYILIKLSQVTLKNNLYYRFIFLKKFFFIKIKSYLNKGFFKLVSLLFN